MNLTAEYFLKFIFKFFKTNTTSMLTVNLEHWHRDIYGYSGDPQRAEGPASQSHLRRKSSTSRPRPSKNKLWIEISFLVRLNYFLNDA